ncbi:MAG: hypothetical protein JSU78_07750 [Deltaproteobacteria bacterium]|nr:MAG: hypothetical protein JSU78_07750 [Deltaproteobacteria bacterium]
MSKEILKPITIRAIPANLWNQVKAKAILEGKTAREVVIELFQQYTKKKGG